MTKEIGEAFAAVAVFLGGGFAFSHACSQAEREKLAVEAGRVVCCTIAHNGEKKEICAKAGELAMALLRERASREAEPLEQDAGGD